MDATRLALLQKVADITCQRPRDENREQFDGYYIGVGIRPSAIRVGVFLP